MHRHRRPRRRIGVPKGMLRHITLNILSQEPMSGSELTEQIYDYTDWRPSPGSMYPLLASLQEKDLIMPHEDEDKTLKRFTLTDEGIRLVEIHKREDELRHRPPSEHHQERRHGAGNKRRRDHRARHTRRAPGEKRVLLQPLHEPVQRHQQRLEPSKNFCMCLAR